MRIADIIKDVCLSFQDHNGYMEWAVKCSTRVTDILNPAKLIFFFILYEAMSVQTTSYFIKCCLLIAKKVGVEFYEMYILFWW